MYLPEPLLTAEQVNAISPDIVVVRAKLDRPSMIAATTLSWGFHDVMDNRIAPTAWDSAALEP